jgi:hypothetical protein
VPPQPFVARSVVYFPCEVTWSIDFNHKSLGVTVEVDHVRPEWGLSPEFKAG